MTSKVRWSLPDGVDELLPPKALEVETLRRKLLDEYFSKDYQLIIPPILELSETIGGEAHEEIRSHAFSFKDNLTGKNLSIRPDISEQASRIDAYRIQSNEIVKLCYAGDVVKSRASKTFRSRTTIQVGAEIFGDPSIEAELESINLMLRSIELSGINKTTLNVGHAGLIASVLEPFTKLDESEFFLLEKALSQKSKNDLKKIVPDSFETKSSLLALCDMYGNKEILDTARKEFSYISSAKSSLDRLSNIIDALESEGIEDIHIDLGEIQGFKYHNGVVFSAYSNEAGYVLSKGGRYDGLRKADNESRPAVGFDLDLIAVTNF